MTDIGELKVSIKADAAQLDRELTRVRAATEQTSQKMGVSLGLLRAQFLALGGAVSLGGLVKSITTFEKLEASLKTVTGSAANAQEALKFVQDFAATTPFDLAQVTEAFIKLTALGLEPSKDALTSYGNTASAMGKSLNQFIEAVADAATGEFERLKEFGIKARQQGDQVTFTFQGVSTTVGKSAGEIEAYLRKIGNTQFAGAMQEQADTAGVALSNLGDSFSKLGKAIGDAGVTKLIVEIARGVSFAADKIAAFSKAVSDLQAIVNRNDAKGAAAEKGYFGAPLALGTVSDTRPETTNAIAFDYKQQFGPPAGPPRASSPSGSNTAATARAKQIKDARQALADYNRSLQEEAALSQLSDRDAVMQEARFKVEEIARKGNIKLTKEQVEASAALAAQTYDLKKAQEDANKATQEAARFQQELHDKLSATLTDIAFKAGSAQQAMLGFAESIAKAAFEKKVAGPLADALIGTGGKSGLLDAPLKGLGGLFGGFFADGGSPPVGVPSIVGERGPEIFVPNTAGTIVPNNKIGTTTVVVQQTINLSPGLAETVNTAIRNAAPAIAAQAQAGVFAAIQQGGGAAKLVGARS